MVVMFSASTKIQTGNVEYKLNPCPCVVYTLTGSALSVALVGGIAGGVGGALLFVIIILVFVVCGLMCQVRRRGTLKVTVTGKQHEVFMVAFAI